MSGYRKPKAVVPEPIVVEAVLGFAGKIDGRPVLIPTGARLRADDPIVRKYVGYFVASPATGPERGRALIALRARKDRPHVGRAQALLRSVRGDPA